MNKNFFVGLSVTLVFAGLYFYRPSLNAAIRRATNTSVSTVTQLPQTSSMTAFGQVSGVPAVVAVKNINLPLFLNTSGIMTKDEVDAMRSFLTQLGQEVYDNYRSAIFAVVNRLKRDPWYNTFANLNPVAPATVITDAQIVSTGESLFPKPTFPANFYASQAASVRPNAQTLANLKKLFADITNTQSQSISAGDHSRIAENLFKHISEFTVPIVLNNAPRRPVSRRV